MLPFNVVNKDPGCFCFGLRENFSHFQGCRLRLADEFFDDIHNHIRGFKRHRLTLLSYVFFFFFVCVCVCVCVCVGGGGGGGGGGVTVDLKKPNK